MFREFNSSICNMNKKSPVAREDNIYLRNLKARIFYDGKKTPEELKKHSS